MLKYIPLVYSVDKRFRYRLPGKSADGFDNYTECRQAIRDAGPGEYAIIAELTGTDTYLINAHITEE